VLAQEINFPFLFQACRPVGKNAGHGAAAVTIGPAPADPIRFTPGDRQCARISSFGNSLDRSLQLPVGEHNGNRFPIQHHQHGYHYHQKTDNPGSDFEYFFKVLLDLFFVFVFL
jgi:hypothetical protein